MRDRPRADAIKANDPRLEQAIGHTFSNPALLLTALTHRSFSSPHNERLEFLGDSILNCVIARQLFDRFPGIPEGDLSRLRANLVRQDSLHQLALSLSLGKVLRLGEGELKSGGAQRPSILADALEALFGAIWLDAGFDAASAVIVRLYGDMLGAIVPGQPIKDAKTASRNDLQGRRLPLPKYSLSATEVKRMCSNSGLPARSMRCTSGPKAAAAVVVRPNKWPPSARWKD